MRAAHRMSRGVCARRILQARRGGAKCGGGSVRVDMLGKLVMVLACGAWVGAMAVQIPTLNWQKRSDWLDVRSVGAKGDGKTDDTDAIARALLAQTDTEYGCGQPGHCGNATKTIYFPPGVYPISKQLTINHMYGGALLGHGAATTILWVGEKAPLVAGPEYAMLLDNGTSYFHFEGLTWDGAGKAATAVDHYSQTRKLIACCLPPVQWVAGALTRGPCAS